MERERQKTTECRWRLIAPCVIAMALGLGQAHADMADFHEGGQGRDKEASAFAAEKRSGGREASASALVASGPATPELEIEAPPESEGAALAALEPEALDARTRTRTITRTFVKDGFVTSRTRSKSIALDEDGNRAVARAVARVSAPNDVAAVRNGAGRILAKSSVAVTGGGDALAHAGGSIGISAGKVEVSTWGRTSAEVF